jgi:hypothetical protein
MKHLPIASLLVLLVLGGCASIDTSYLDETGFDSDAKKIIQQGGFKANAQSNRYKSNVPNSKFWGVSETSQEEANENALEQCKQSKRRYTFVNNPELCLLAYEGNKKVWEENDKKRIEDRRIANQKRYEESKEKNRVALEKRKQEEFNRLYITCLGFGFTEQNAIAPCIQQEIFNEKKLLVLKEQQIALNSVQVEKQEEESGFFLKVLEGVSESLADPQTWEIARNKAEIQRLKRSR